MPGGVDNFFEFRMAVNQAIAECVTAAANQHQRKLVGVPGQQRDNCFQYLGDRRAKGAEMPNEQAAIGVAPADFEDCPGLSAGTTLLGNGSHSKARLGPISKGRSLVSHAGVDSQIRCAARNKIMVIRRCTTAPAFWRHLPLRNGRKGSCTTNSTIWPRRADRYHSHTQKNRFSDL